MEKRGEIADKEQLVQMIQALERRQEEGSKSANMVLLNAILGPCLCG
jgi:hypothetical protein